MAKDNQTRDVLVVGQGGVKLTNNTRPDITRLKMQQAFGETHNFPNYLRLIKGGW